MHELGITNSLVAIVGEAAAGRRVRKVWLEVGVHAALLPDALRFCYDVVTKGTPLEASTLEVVELPTGLQCEDCRHAGLADGTTACPKCGGTRLALRTGNELNIQAMEVEPCA
ncbi:MAG: hydrogenase maturation nickel metallochaperone HypA [Pseudomonadota bacterium]|jgi:hydrogenase nickel incorporation protein HypA/HybF